MAEKTTLPPDAKIIPALAHHFTLAQPGGVVTGREQLIELLQKLPSLSSEDHVDTISTQLKKHESGITFAVEDQAIVAFIDDAMTEVLSQTDLDFKIESFIRGIAPHLAAAALSSGLKAVTRKSDFFDLIDLLIDECIGWSEDLGILGQQYMDKIQVGFSGFTSGRLTAAESIGELQTDRKSVV